MSEARWHVPGRSGRAGIGGAMGVAVGVAILVAGLSAAWAQKQSQLVSDQEARRAEEYFNAYAETLGEMTGLAEACGVPADGFARTVVLRAGMPYFDMAGQQLALTQWETGHDKNFAPACDEAAKRRLAEAQQQASEERAGFEKILGARRGP